MSVQKLQPWAIITFVLGVIVIMGMAVLSSFSYTVRDSTTTAVNSITLQANGTATDIGATGVYPYLQTVTGCVNASNGSTALSTSYYTVQEGDEDGGSITLADAGATWTGETINCSSVTYLADTSAQGTADTFKTGLSIFGTFIGVIVLALLGKIVMGLFKSD